MFGKVRTVLMLCLLVAGAAFVTAPGKGAGEIKLREELMAALDQADTARADDALGQIALRLCKLDREACYDAVRGQIETRYQHRTLYSVFHAEGFGKEATCYGVFTRYVCPGGLVDTIRD